MSMKSKYKSSYKRRFNRNSNRVMLLVFCILALVGVIGTFAFLLLSMKAKDTKQVDQSQISVYIAKENIISGQEITESMLEEIQVKPEMPANYYCNLDCLEQIAIVDIPQGMTILHNMLCIKEMKDEQREVECEIITLSDNLTENDYVDVRIMMPNGEDYIVLAKKSVHDLMRSEDNEEERCYLWMSEDEILYYSAAIVDAYLYPGASLYTTKYIEPMIQKESIVTYVPSIGTITMMKENPNIIQEAIKYLKEDHRKQLENRLTDYLNKDIREVLWQDEDNSTINSASSLDGVVMEKIEANSPTPPASNLDDAATKIEEQTKDDLGENPTEEDTMSVFVDDSDVKEASME